MGVSNEKVNEATNDSIVSYSIDEKKKVLQSIIYLNTFLFQTYFFIFIFSYGLKKIEFPS